MRADSQEIVNEGDLVAVFGCPLFHVPGEDNASEMDKDEVSRTWGQRQRTAFFRDVAVLPVVGPVGDAVTQCLLLFRDDDTGEFHDGRVQLTRTEELTERFAVQIAVGLEKVGNEAAFNEPLQLPAGDLLLGEDVENLLGLSQGCDAHRNSFLQ